MKTPLMELIEWIKNEPYTVERTSIITKATELLEKEKRALMEAHHNGQINEHESAFDYFTKTFTEKKD